MFCIFSPSSASSTRTWRLFTRSSFPSRSIEILRERKIELIAIPEEEFPTQGCNVLALAPRRAVMLERNPLTKKALEAAGCVVQVIKGDEIAFKGSGGPTCLTRPLLRA